MIESVPNLKQIRKELKMTQAEIARQVGVALATYLLWERGVGNPNEENLEKLMRIISKVIVEQEN